MNINKQNLTNRFINYCKIETTSDPASLTAPSTPTQLNLSKLLVEECKALGLEDLTLCQNGIVMATLPANIDYDVPVIGFLAHVDTSNQASGKDVSPQIVENYQGQDIPFKNGLVLSPGEFPHLKNYIGQDLITSDGTTLLGADNKAGVAIIMEAMTYLKNNPDIKHGKIRIAFTPDEEIGRGVDNFDVKAFGASFAYTIDGGEIGELENESFNGASAKIEIEGKSVHPGLATGIMVNACLIARDVMAAFPDGETPEATEGKEGFYLVTNMHATIEGATLNYIIRDHHKGKFEERKAFAQNAIDQLNKKYDNRITLTLKDSYYNMKEVLDKHPETIALAKEAIEKVGVTPNLNYIRGGTDGCRLCFMGLPCPNIFSGGHNYHGPYEYIPIQSMVKSCEVVATICQLVGNKKEGK